MSNQNVNEAWPGWIHPDTRLPIVSAHDDGFHFFDIAGNECSAVLEEKYGGNDLFEATTTTVLYPPDSFGYWILSIRVEEIGGS
jgi:hypothetical protein